MHPWGIIFGLVFVLINMIAHESGHAIAMRHRGVPIKQAGIGLPLGKIKLTFHPSFLPFPVIVTPLLIGAFVEPTKEGGEMIKQMSYKDSSSINGAGVIMNLVLGAVTFAAAAIVAGGSHIALVLIGSAISVAVFLLLRRYISMAMPFFGFVVGVALVWLSLGFLDEIGGPVTTIKLYASFGSPYELLLLGFLVALDLALFNMIPVSFLDGGHIFTAFLEKFRLKKFAEAYSIVTTLVLFGLFIVLVGKDIIGLF